MKFIGSLLTIAGFAFVAAAVALRLDNSLLKLIPLEGLTPSSFAHFGNTLFVAAIAAFLMAMSYKK